MNRSAIALILALFLPPAWAAEGTSLRIDDAVAAALAGNPGLAEIRARAEALSFVPAQAGALPEPVLTIGALSVPVDTFDLDQEAMTQVQVSISQPLPFPGKLGLQRAAAGHEAEAAAEDVRERQLMLARDVRLVWWNLYYLDRALETVARNQELLRQLGEVAKTRYGVGQGLQQDVLLAQVELSGLLDEEAQLTGMRRVEAARLNTLLGRPAEVAVELPATDGPLADVGEAEELFQRALASRPLLAVIDRRNDAADARLDLARRNYFPDFRVGIGYGWREDRADLATLQFSMNLPIFTGSRQDPALEQRRRELIAVQDARADARLRVREQIVAARADYAQARERLALFDTGILPQARQTVASMLAGYQVNRVDFLNLARAQVNLHNFETRRWNTYTQARQAQARLRAAIGEDEVIHE